MIYHNIILHLQYTLYVHIMCKYYIIRIDTLDPFMDWITQSTYLLCILMMCMYFGAHSLCFCPGASFPFPIYLWAEPTSGNSMGYSCLHLLLLVNAILWYINICMYVHVPISHPGPIYMSALSFNLIHNT